MTETPENSQPEFFLVALPGFESLVQAEVKDWFPEFETRLEHGGVTVSTSLGAGLAMNQALKIPTRILVRVAQFRVRDFPKLFHKVSNVPWRQWIDVKSDLEVQAATRSSRLRMKKRIETTCLEGWQAYQKKNGGQKSSGKKVGLYVRLIDDICTLSLDSSGERLHKRGLRQHIGEAPLRETIAAGLIQLIGQSYETDAPKTVEIIDPMMGSGTFLLEAAYRDHLIEKRDFAFDMFTSQPEKAPALQATRPVIKSLIGYEMDKKTIQAAKTNLKSVDATINTKVIQEDFFSSSPLPETSHKRWLLCNPPYGERLKVNEPLAQLYTRLFAAAELVASPERACFLLPSKAVKGKFALPKGWKVLKKLPFLNGGIPVTAFVFGRSV